MNRDQLLGWVTEQLQNDQRVRGLWITGSTARGTDDEFSDLDLLAVVTDEGRADFAATWVAQVAESMPLVHHQLLDFGPTVVVNHIVGDDWLRFDLTLGPADNLRTRSQQTAKVVFDHDHLNSALPAEAPPTCPSPEVIARVVPEFLRVAGLLPVAVGRADYVVAASGSALLRTLLIQLMVESVEVEDRGGALHLQTLLAPDHFRLLENLPPITATRESAIAVQQACFDAFVPVAQDLCRRTGVPWPETFADAVRCRLAPLWSAQPGLATRAK
jgi:hypothetical protein